MPKVSKMYKPKGTTHSPKSSKRPAITEKYSPPKGAMHIQKGGKKG